METAHFQTELGVRAVGSQFRTQPAAYLHGTVLQRTLFELDGIVQDHALRHLELPAQRRDIVQRPMDADLLFCTKGSPRTPRLMVAVSRPAFPVSVEITRWSTHSAAAKGRSVRRIVSRRMLDGGKRS